MCARFAIGVYNCMIVLAESCMLLQIKLTKKNKTHTNKQTKTDIKRKMW